MGAFQEERSGKGQAGREGKGAFGGAEAFNKQFAKERIVVEHTNFGVKKFLIWGGEFRNCLKYYDVAAEIVSGIVNFRIT